MDFTAIAFGVLSTVLLGAALLVITARNPVHAVLFLILSFFSGAGLFGYLDGVDDTLHLIHRLEVT